VSLDLNALRDLLASINQTDITELTLKSEDFELTVRRDSHVAPPVGVAAAATVLPPPLVAVAPADLPKPAETSSTPPPAAKDRRWVEITSPMVGTFYRAPGPDEAPFVDVGDRIRPGQTVCIIEAMKLMNELEAEVAGEIVEVLVQNGSPVEYGQPLMRVNPG
jgi:acetyl-CoA carboxylase biotin carboxyl carrier protein